jgi:flagellar basal-body rod modification protein FlgD
MATDPISGTSGSNKNAGAAAGNAATSALGSKEFLTLMVTQLKNQDPFKPSDPTQFVSQLAQFGTVSGIQEMQGSITSLSDSLRSSQVLGGSTLVGHEVLADATAVTLGEAGSLKGAVQIPEGTTNALLVVTDSSGQLVRRVPLSTTEGEQEFTWDGTTDLGTRAPAGTYDIQAVAQVGGAAEEVITSIASKVNSVTIDPSTFKLTLNTQMGPVALANVRRVM